MHTTKGQLKQHASPVVSIITPSLNQGTFIERTILSVLNQTYHNIEYIVMDGGSTDDTIRILRKYDADTRFAWFSGKDGGQYDAVNNGFLRARGDILGWINADDIYTEHAVEKAVHAFETMPCVDVVYGRLYSFVERGKYTRVLYTRPFSYRWLRRYCFTNPSATFVRASLIQDGFLIDTAVPTFGDWDWFLRIAEAGKRFYHIPEIITGFRIHSSSRIMQMDTRTIRKERCMIARRHHITLDYMSLWVDIVIPWFERLQNAHVLVRKKEWRELFKRIASSTAFVITHARKRMVL